MIKTTKELTEMATRWQQAPGNDEFFSLGEITSFCDHFAVGIQRLMKEVDATEFNYQKLLEELLDVKEAGRRRAEYWQDQLDSHADWRDRVASICEYILPRVIDDGDQCAECLDELRALLHFRDKTSPDPTKTMYPSDMKK